MDLELHFTLGALAFVWEEGNPLAVGPTSHQVALVIHGDVAEQVGHGLSVVDAADGLSQNHADIHCLDFRTLEFLDFMRDGVGHHHLGSHDQTKLCTLKNDITTVHY